MKQKKYRLAVVLEVRGQKKESAARFLAQRRQELFETERELTRRYQFLEDCREKIFESNEKMMDEFGAGTSAGNIVSHKNYLNRLKEREDAILTSVEEQKSNVNKAENFVEEAINKLAEASKELKVIEKHKEKWTKSEKREEAKQEQKVSDEIAAILHQHSKKL